MSIFAPTAGITSCDASPRNRPYKAALWAAGLALTWWVIDLAFARTIVVTPIDASVWWASCLAGVIGGAWIGLVVAAHQHRKAGPKAVGKRPVIVVLFCSLGILFGPLIANRAMWRIENMRQFWHSEGRIAPANFPIKSVSSGKGNNFTVSIGSRGQHDALPISKQDFQLLGGAGSMQRPWKFCLSLRRQEEGRAVRIWLPSNPRPSFKGLTIDRCPASVQWID